jgi:hypothetical protein
MAQQRRSSDCFEAARKNKLEGKAFGEFLAGCLRS